VTQTGTPRPATCNTKKRKPAADVAALTLGDSVELQHDVESSPILVQPAAQPPSDSAVTGAFNSGAVPT
jgi:hypothetical protein